MSNLEDVQAFGKVHLSSIVYASVVDTYNVTRRSLYSTGFKMEATDLKRGGRDDHNVS